MIALATIGMQPYHFSIFFFKSNRWKGVFHHDQFGSKSPNKCNLFGHKWPTKLTIFGHILMNKVNMSSHSLPNIVTMFGHSGLNILYLFRLSWSNRSLLYQLTKLDHYKMMHLDLLNAIWLNQNVRWTIEVNLSPKR